jgi:hypothetical protein
MSTVSNCPVSQGPEVYNDLDCLLLKNATKDSKTPRREIRATVLNTGHV